jgi:4-amino-4-deoxy-L-arabinose transferase-like glycosyltransferase
MKGITTKGLWLFILLFPTISFAGWGREWGNSGSGYILLLMLIFTVIFSAIFVGLILAVLTRLVLFMLNSFNILQSSYISDFKENKRVRVLTILVITIVTVTCLVVINKSFLGPFIMGIILGLIAGTSFRYFLLKFI